MRPRKTTEKQDREFLALRRQGWTCREIGLEHDFPTSTVHGSIARARLAETPAGPQIPCPRLEPLFPITALTPHSRCAHHCKECGGRGAMRFALEGPPPPCKACKGTGDGPIPAGAGFVCMVCPKHQSGQDHHPALRRTAATDPKPEKKPAAPAAAKKTRKQRRGLIERLNPSKN